MTRRARRVGTEAADALAADQRARAARPGSVPVRSRSSGSGPTETGEPGPAGDELDELAAGPSALGAPLRRSPARVRPAQSAPCRPHEGALVVVAGTAPPCSSRHPAVTFHPSPWRGTGRAVKCHRLWGQGVGLGAASPDQRRLEAGTSAGGRSSWTSPAPTARRSVEARPGLFITLAREANGAGGLLEPTLRPTSGVSSLVWRSGACKPALTSRPVIILKPRLEFSLEGINADPPSDSF